MQSAMLSVLRRYLLSPVLVSPGWTAFGAGIAVWVGVAIGMATLSG